MVTVQLYPLIFGGHARHCPECDDLYVNPDAVPYVIQIAQNSAPWWQVWLPLLGSVIVASAAITGVLISNRTNRSAIAATQRNVESTNSAAAEREHEKWRREQILQSATKILTTTHECHGILERDPAQQTAEQRIDILRTLGSHQSALLGHAQSLLMLGAHDLAQECNVIRGNLIVARGAYGQSQLLITAPVSDDTPPKERQDRMEAFGAAITRLGESEKAMRKAQLAFVDEAQKLLTPRADHVPSSTPRSPE